MRWASLLPLVAFGAACAPGPVTGLGGPVLCAGAQDGATADGGTGDGGTGDGSAGEAPATCPISIPADGDTCNEEVACSYCADAGVRAIRCDGTLWLTVP